jgi:hypothetical protein
MTNQNSKEIPFFVVEDELIPLENLAKERLGRLLTYWNQKRGKGILPIGACIDPMELREHLTRLHILDVQGPRRFRYRLYGTKVTNPDLADMTGKLTTDYRDKAFAELVTTHLSECVESAAPICREVIAVKNRLPYSYRRLVLPWSKDGVRVSKLMVSPQRILIPAELDRATKMGEFAR